MDMNNNLANMTPKVKCGFCEKSFFGEFLSKHMRISHPGVERPKKKKSSEIKLQQLKNDYINQSNCNITLSNQHLTKVEKVLKGSLDLIPSSSPSVKIQIMGGKICLRCKGNVLPYNFK